MPLQVKIKSPEGGTLKTANTYIEDDINIVPNLQDKTITQNGEYTADEGYAGLGNINIQVAGEGGVDTSQDTVTADAMLEGTTAHDASGEPITGTIPTYVGGMPEIMRENNVMVLPTAGKYCNYDINIQPAMQDITITENGTATPDAGYVGFSKVIVEVAGSGGDLSEIDALIGSGVLE